MKRTIGLMFAIAIWLLTGQAAWAENVTYIDQDGIEQTADATPLTGNETSLDAGWYWVNSDITYSQAIQLLIEFSEVHIILANGKTMTIDLTSSDDAYAIESKNMSSGLFLYTQSNTGSAGKLHIKLGKEGQVGIQASDFTQNGGILQIELHGNNQKGAYFLWGMTINGGKMEIKSYAPEKSDDASCGLDLFGFTMNGGVVDIDMTSPKGNAYGIKTGSGETIKLGYRDFDNDYIQVATAVAANSYSPNYSVEIAAPCRLTDGTNIYDGTLTEEQVAAISGKKVQPYGMKITAHQGELQGGNEWSPFGVTKYWATFYYPNKHFRLQDGVLAFYVVKSENRYLFFLLGEEGNEIPADCAVILMSESADIILTKIDSTLVDAPTDNQLRGTNSTQAAEDFRNKDIYMLGKIGYDDDYLNMYPLNGNTERPPYKAYLVIE